jgi:hypothetical protein
MTVDYLLMKDAIQKELENLKEVVKRVFRIERRIEAATEDRDFFIEAMAIELHGFYTGLEKIFEGIAKMVDHSMPSGDHWHNLLLQQMSLDIPGIRPPVLSEQTLNALKDYLSFRHVVRNVYAYNFDYTRISKLVQKLDQTFSLAQEELAVFSEFLNEVGLNS